jgi:hypothetical protein
MLNPQFILPIAAERGSLTMGWLQHPQKLHASLQPAEQGHQVSA